MQMAEAELAVRGLFDRFFATGSTGGDRGSGSHHRDVLSRTVGCEV
ncbi:hypothetical protein GCM10009854_05610 [Saccharopolyspora halophila]|uniref:Uncharacterized protein n=1 Tax=Saccharopolyspora halophila TaxID=405551 RepID=A0ABN3FLQ7_9PSEU